MATTGSERVGIPTANLMAELKEVVARIAAIPEVHRFYIGRTNDPAGRQSDHGADDLVTIYTTTVTHQVQYVESQLISDFRKHPKFDNKALDARGNVADGDVQYVYVAIWT